MKMKHRVLRATITSFHVTDWVSFFEPHGRTCFKLFIKSMR